MLSAGPKVPSALVKGAVASEVITSEPRIDDELQSTPSVTLPPTVVLSDNSCMLAPSTHSMLRVVARDFFSRREDASGAPLSGSDELSAI